MIMSMATAVGLDKALAAASRTSPTTALLAADCSSGVSASETISSKSSTISSTISTVMFS